MTIDKSLVANFQEEKDFFERARILKSLTREQRIPLKTVSRDLGLKPSYLCHILRLNKLPDLVIDGFYSGTVSISHLFVLSRLKSDEDMIEVYEKILTENLTVLRTDEAVRGKLYKVTHEGEYLTENEKREFQEILSGKNVTAKIIQTRVKAKLLFEVKGSLKKTSTALRHLMERFSS